MSEVSISSQTLFFFSSIVFGFPWKLLFEESMSCRALSCNPLLLSWSPVDVVVRHCGGEAVCNLMIKSCFCFLESRSESCAMTFQKIRSDECFPISLCKGELPEWGPVISVSLTLSQRSF